MPTKIPQRGAQKVLSVAEIKELQRQKVAIQNSMVGKDPVLVDVKNFQPMLAFDSQGKEEFAPKAVQYDGADNSLDVLKDAEVRNVALILKEQGIDPIIELTDAYNARDEDPESINYGKFLMPPVERRALMKELLKYVHPQLKSIDHQGNGGGNKVIVVLQMPDGSQSVKEVEARGKQIDV